MGYFVFYDQGSLKTLQEKFIFVMGLIEYHP